MQTFLPFESFSRSAEALDSPRLGKQRVETLQVLRALVLPGYGWQAHPAVQMWRGYVPALTRYGLDMVEAWTDRGHADSTAPQMLEFAPEVAGLSQRDLGNAGRLPSWIGREDLHLSHRSNLVRKAPQIYGPVFPGVPDDLPYLWPGPDPSPAEDDEVPGATLWILRARDEAEMDEWRATGEVRLGVVSPRGTVSRKWRGQLDDFASGIRRGDRVAVLTGPGTELHTGVVTGYPRDVSTGDETPPFVARAVDFDGVLARSAMPYPAMLQDPRVLFPVRVES
ncbi:MSMEG_6728 family protein [Planctomonas psychrotolerans]|uniref:MSMEG_6728 family protein n=1 Tax=Planctomonas psychrotolerans TaxID=2528712 RepID=UPI00123A522F|nr:MSMEG_6728 family protein [Planctomonas psychrotolerans]